VVLETSQFEHRLGPFFTPLDDSRGSETARDSAVSVLRVAAVMKRRLSN
jgi:hypothetical protein